MKVHATASNLLLKNWKKKFTYAINPWLFYLFETMLYLNFMHVNTQIMCICKLKKDMKKVLIVARDASSLKM